MEQTIFFYWVGLLFVAFVTSLLNASEIERYRWSKRFQTFRWNVSVDDFVPSTASQPPAHQQQSSTLDETRTNTATGDIAVIIKLTRDEEAAIRQSFLLEQVQPYSMILSEDDFVRKNKNNNCSASELSINDDDDNKTNRHSLAVSLGDETPLVSDLKNGKDDMNHDEDNNNNVDVESGGHSGLGHASVVVPNSSGGGSTTATAAASDTNDDNTVGIRNSPNDNDDEDNNNNMYYDEAELDLVRIPYPGERSRRNADDPNGTELAESSSSEPSSAAVVVVIVDNDDDPVLGRDTGSTNGVVRADNDNDDCTNNNNETNRGDCNCSAVRHHHHRRCRRRQVPGGCAICLGEFMVGEEIAWSSNEQCSHVFHKPCLLEWLNKSGQMQLARLRKKRDTTTTTSTTTNNNSTTVEDVTMEIISVPWQCPVCRQYFIVSNNGNDRDNNTNRDTTDVVPPAVAE